MISHVATFQVAKEEIERLGLAALDFRGGVYIVGGSRSWSLPNGLAPGLNK